MGNIEERIRGLEGQDMSMCSMDYLNSIRKASGNPIILSPINDEKYIDNILEVCDGLVFSGGSDISSIYYNEIPGECGRIIPERDDFELTLLEKALNKNIPILGICRGLQLLNIFFGGKNFQDIKSADHRYFSHDIINLPRWHDVHSVKLKEKSHLALAYNSNTIKTNSLHHQSIKDLGENLIATAWSEDGIIEGAELKNKNFVVGVQWHPEMMYSHSEIHLQLFKYFIDKIKSHKTILGGVK